MGKQCGGKVSYFYFKISVTSAFWRTTHLEVDCFTDEHLWINVKQKAFFEYRITRVTLDLKNIRS